MISRTISIALLMFTPTMAINAQESKHYRFELTPYVGARAGGSFEDPNQDQDLDLEESGSFGLILDIQASANTQYEILISRQNTQLSTGTLFQNQTVLDMDADYYHLGGTYFFEAPLGRPFIAATFGLSRFSPSPPGFDSENFFSMSFGSGYKFPMGQRLSLRLEARAYVNFIGGDSDIFCQTGAANTCAFAIDSDVLTQWEALAGLTFRF